MLEYETYSEKKWMERHSIREDSVYLREEDGRAKDKQRREYSSSKGIMSKHLEDVNMDYMVHLGFAWILALKLFLLSLIALVHGLLPFIFTSTVSNGVNQLTHDLDKGNNT